MFCANIINEIIRSSCLKLNITLKNIVAQERSIGFSYYTFGPQLEALLAENVVLLGDRGLLK